MKRPKNTKIAASVGIAAVLLLWTPIPAHSSSLKSCLISVLSRYYSKQDQSLRDVAGSKFKAKFNRDPQLRVQWASDPGKPRYSETVMMSESGQRLGDLSFSVDKDRLTIGLMYVEPNYRELGLGGALLEAVLEKYPQIRQIHVEQLSHDNAETFERQLARGKTREGAIKSTAAYKIRKKLGFGKIVPGSVDSQGGFSVIRD